MFSNKMDDKKLHFTHLSQLTTIVLFKVMAISYLATVKEFSW